MKKLIIFTLLSILTIALFAQTAFFTEDWESEPAGWTFANPTSYTVNQWTRGTAIKNGGDYGVYITSMGNPQVYSVPTISHFYKEVSFPEVESNMILQFDLNCVGHPDDGYVRVYLQPLSEPAPTASSNGSMPVGSQTEYMIGEPAYLGTNGWARISINIPSTWSELTGRLVFTFTTSSAFDPPAIDNISIFTVADDDPPFPATIVSPANGGTLIAPGVSLNWVPNPAGNQPTGYTVYFDTTPIPANPASHVYQGSATTFTPTTTFSNTYYWKVVPYMGDGAERIHTPIASCPQWTFTTAPPPQALPFIEDWEAGSSRWTIVNGPNPQTNVNKWYRGTAPANNDTYSMYISVNNGMAHNYAPNQLSVSHFYTDIAFDAGEPGFSITFDFLGLGENNFDDLRVFLVSTSITPVAGNSLSEETPLGTYWNTPNWTNQQIAIPGTWAGSVGRLVFSWRNNANGGQAGSPAAVDNIFVLSTAASGPPFAASLVNPANGAINVLSSIALAWAPATIGTSPDGYTVYLGAGTTPPISEVYDGPLTTFAPTLVGNQLYYWQVKPYAMINNVKEYATNCPVWSFTTIEDGLVIVGTGNMESKAPVFANYNYTASQMIYKSDELATAGLTLGQITGIRFQAHNQPPQPLDLSTANHWNIRMMETSATALTNWVDPAGTTEVFNTTLSVTSIPVDGWLNITLEHPFLYTGTNNLLIQVIDLNSSGNQQMNAQFKGHTTGTSPTSYLTRWISKDNGLAFNPTDSSNWVGDEGFGGPVQPTSTGNRPNLRLVYVGPQPGADLGIVSFTGPSLIPTTTDTDMVISIMNMSSDDDVVATDYSVEIFELVPDNANPGQFTTFSLANITSASTVTTVPVASGNFATADIIIPPSIFNGWNYQGDGGPVTLRAVITYAGDSNANNTAEFTTALAAEVATLEILDSFAPVLIPTVDDMWIEVANTGRATMVAQGYKVEVLESWFATPGVPSSYDSNVLYTIGLSSDDQTATALDAGETKTYSIIPSVYNGWTYTKPAGESFYLVYRLSYNDGTSDIVVGDSLQVTTRPSYDLEIASLSVPVTIPHPSTPHITVMMQNNGRETVAAQSYKVELFEMVPVADSDPNPVLIHTIDGAGAVVLAPGEAHPYNITWSTLFPSAALDHFTATNGAVTLMAKVTNLSATKTEADVASETNNNSKQANTVIAPKYDLEISGVTGPSLIPSFTDLVISVKNNGRYDVLATGHEVTLHINQASNTAIFTFATGSDADETTEFITTAGSKTYTIPANIYCVATANQISGDFTLVAVVTMVGVTDAVGSNNQGTLASRRLDINVDGIVEVGIGGTRISPSVPFGVGYKDSVAQTIYKKSDLGGLDYAIISHIMYRFRRSNLSPSADYDNYNVSVYMKNVPVNDRPNGFTSITNWEPTTEANRVVDSFDLELGSLPVSPANTAHEIWIPIVPPFLYTGGNLIITTWQDHNGGISLADAFLHSEWDPIETNYWTLNQTSDVANANNFPNIIGDVGMRGRSIPQTKFAVNLPSTDPDLAITSFTGPASIPGTEPMHISVTNNSVQSVAGNAYTIEFRAGAGANPIYTIPSSEAEAFSELGSTFTHEIEAAVYNNWTYGVLGATTLRATVVYASDVNAQNNYETMPIYINPDHDLELLSLTAPAVLNLSDPIVITVQNKGRTAVASGSYKVELFEIEIGAGDTEIPHLITTFETTDAVAIPLNGSESFDVTPEILNAFTYHTTHGNIKFRATVTYTGQTDGELGNNIKDITVYRFTYVAEVGVSTSSLIVGSSANLPFSVYYHDSVSQSIYRKAELSNVATASITHINYKYFRGPNSFGGDFPPAPVNIYMANFDKPTGFTSDTDWVPYYFFTLVKTGFSVASATQGINEFWVELDTPFNYTGQDLIVYTVKNQTTTVTNNVDGFYHTPSVAGSNVSLHRAANNTEYFVESPGSGATGDPVISHYKPQMRFALNIDGYGIVSGAISDEYENPISGATVAIEGLSGVFTTDSSGEYSVLVNVTSTAEIVFSATNYTTVRVAIDDLDWVGTTGVQRITYDVTLQGGTPPPTATVNGSITRTSGSLAGFDITFTNTAPNSTPLTTTTNDTGQFTFTTVPYGTYILTAHLPGTNADGVAYGTYTSEAILVNTHPTTIPPINMTPHSDADDVNIPVVTALKTNYPNPFNPTTTIAFDLAQDGMVSIDVYNIKGQKVKEVVNGSFRAGRHSVVWNGDDESGKAVGSGVYFYRMTNGEYQNVRKMLLMK